MKDANFWDGCRRVISKIILPSKLIGEAESDLTFLFKIYDFFQDSLKLDVYSEQEVSKINHRWDFIHTESMGFAYVLHPKTKGGLGMVGSDLEDTIMQLHEYLEAQNENIQAIQEEFQSYTQLVAEPGAKFEAFF